MEKVEDIDSYDMIGGKITPQEAKRHLNHIYPGGKIPKMTSHTIKAMVSISKGTEPQSLAKVVRSIRKSKRDSDHAVE